MNKARLTLITGLLILLATTWITGASPMQAQTAAYSFENNLDDTLNANTGTFLENGEPGTAVYVPFNGSTALSMNPTQGLRLPNTLNDTLDIDGGIEVSFDFQVPKIDTVFGTVNLFSVSEFSDFGEPGIHLIAVRGEPGEPDEPIEYVLQFIYNDGRSPDDIAGHEGYWQTDLGYFQLDQMMNIRLIVDFETKTWTTIVNSELTSSPFETPYNLELIKTAITANEWHFGWVIDQEFEMDWEDHEFTADMILDNLQITSPLSNGNLTMLQSALTAMTEHANGNAPLDEAALTTHLNDIYINYRGNYANAEMEIRQFMQAYEGNFAPLFDNRETTSPGDLPPEEQALLFIQQTIFDEQFVDGNMENMVGIAYQFADIFPGKVSNDAERLAGAAVPINGTYNRIPGAQAISDMFDAKRPTGHYAPAGELVTVEIPASLTNAGLKVLVGAHIEDLSGLSEINRFARITKSIPLDSVSTTVVNPFGGGIYIQVPDGSNLGVIDVTLSGVVKSAYYSTRTDIPSDLASWQTELENGYVPWVDLESDKYMATLPLDHIVDISLTDPTDVMNIWDEMMDAFQYVGGRPPERAATEYFLIDSRLPSDAFGTGYPQVIGSANAPYRPFDTFDLEYYPTYVLQPDFYISEYNTTLHERGHAAFHPTPDGETESIIHLNAVYIYNQVFDTTLDDAFKYSSQEFLTMDETTMDWMIADNFRNNREMGCDPTMAEFLCDEIRYQHRGHAKYIEMADLFGWEAVHNTNKVFYDAWRVDEDALEVTRDTMLRAASEGNGVNMSPLFHFWGHVPSADLQSELNDLPSSPEIYDRLRDYHALVPANQADYQSFYDVLFIWKGGVHEERIQASFDNYDGEQYAVQMQAQVCNLIDTYYPDQPAAECGGTVPLATVVSENSVNDTNRVFVTQFSVIVGVICLLMGSAAVLSRRRL